MPSVGTTSSPCCSRSSTTNGLHSAKRCPKSPGKKLSWSMNEAPYLVATPASASLSSRSRRSGTYSLGALRDGTDATNSPAHGNSERNGTGHLPKTRHSRSPRLSQSGCWDTRSPVLREPDSRRRGNNGPPERFGQALRGRSRFRFGPPPFPRARAARREAPRLGTRPCAS